MSRDDDQAKPWKASLRRPVFCATVRWYSGSLPTFSAAAVF